MKASKEDVVRGQTVLPVSQERTANNKQSSPLEGDSVASAGGATSASANMTKSNVSSPTRRIGVGQPLIGFQHQHPTKQTLFTWEKLSPAEFQQLQDLAACKFARFLYSQHHLT